MIQLIIKIVYISLIIIASLWICSRFYILFSLFILNKSYRLQKAEVFNNNYFLTTDRNKLALKIIGNQKKPDKIFIFIHDYFGSESDFDNLLKNFNKDKDLAIILRQRFNYNFKVQNISIYINDIIDLVDIYQSKYTSNKIHIILYGYSYVYLNKLYKHYPKNKFILINPVLKRRPFILNIFNKLRVVLCFFFTLRFKFKTRIKYSKLTNDNQLLKKYDNNEIKTKYMLDYLQFKIYNWLYLKNSKNHHNDVIIFYNENQFINIKKINKFKYKFKFEGNEYLGVNIVKFYERINQ